MSSVTRVQVVQACLDLYDAPRYLEIGVFRATTFEPVKAAHKVAVDPSFQIGVRERLEKQPDVEVHEVTSDEYFGTIASEQKFDVIYLDGLHTFEQTLRDLLNAITLIKDEGIIVVDDVYPNSYFSSLPLQANAERLHEASGSADRSWMGDVYKLTFFIDSFLQQFSYRMVSNNHGQLVVWRHRRASVTERQVESVARAQYEHVLLEADTQRRMPLDEIIEEVKRDLEGSRHQAKIDESRSPSRGLLSKLQRRLG